MAKLTTQEALDIAQQILGDWAWDTEIETPTPERLDATLVHSEDLMPIVVALRVKQLGYLMGITGLDHGVEANELELLYHFGMREAVITLRVRLPRENPMVESLCEIIPPAEVFEREVMEMLGVTFTGLRNQNRLYLPDDWPEGIYPLRKDFDPAIPVPHV